MYAKNPRNVNHLKSLIEEEFTSLNDNIESCQAICRSVANRCQMFINTEGKQFEHLLSKKCPFFLMNCPFFIVNCFFLFLKNENFFVEFDSGT